MYDSSVMLLFDRGMDGHFIYGNLDPELVFTVYYE
jgi:hypothetical protein